MTTIRARRSRVRRYDRDRGCYVYDISFKAQPPLTDRVVAVAEAFGLGIDEEKTHTVYRDFELRLGESDVVYVTGDSGGGKSLLIRALREDLGSKAVAMDELPDPPTGPIIDAIGSSFQEALSLLSRVGLNDAHLFLKCYGELSEGQRYRFRLAQLIEAGKKYWVCDEFCSTLDRETARIVAYNTQKTARRTGSTLVVATAHTDLEEDLSPSILIRKGWGEDIDIEYRPNEEARTCSVTKDITIRESNSNEYRQLAHLHYREEHAPAPRRYYAAEHSGHVVGVIVYSYPPVFSSGRKLAVGHTPRLSELNAEWTIISRVIVHPKYRSTGLGARLIAETLRLQGKRHVELTAVMAKYSSFAEKAGMKLMLTREPHPSIPEAVEALRRLGFNPALMGSKTHNLKVLKKRGSEERAQVSQVLLGVANSYYKRLARKRTAYVKRDEFEAWLKVQDDASLAYTLKNLSILNQTKAYLYWCKDWEADSTLCG
ncbi:MAG: GNAT family N-acetyltransferase [Candidatus Bathyarchaeota archaeon]